MIYGLAFYKLLGIPESVTEPTAYHLLRLDPRTVTEAMVDGALKARKVRLRQNIPGPQFIPIVSRIERELERAAAILRDPARRGEYNDRLLSQARRKRRQVEGDRRRKLVAACRSAVQSMVDADGCLPAEKRPELARRLDRLGLGDDDVRYVVENTPQPAAREADGSDEQRRQAREQAMQFFLAAVELEIDHGLLDEAGERKLMALAKKLSIASHIAYRKISSQLQTLGAERGTRDESTVAAQFKLHVMAMYPMGDASEVDRKRLLSLAAAEGLSVHEAEKVLQDYLAPLAGEAGEGGEGEAAEAAPQDPLPILRLLAAEEASAPALPGGRRKGAGRAGRYAWMAVGVVLLCLASVGAWKAIEHQLSRPSRPTGRVGTRAEPPGDADIGFTHRPALLTAAFQALHSQEQVRKLFNDANEATRVESLSAAADLVIAGGTPRGEVLAEGVFKALLHCPPAKAAAQDAAVGALNGRLRRLAGSGRLGRAKVYRAAGMLASTLLLRPTPGFTVTDPAEMAGFLDRCELAWNDSREKSPADPANDAKRLAYAVIQGGSLPMYAERADAQRLADVTDELARVAADGRAAGAREALESLTAFVGRSGYPKETRQVARLAMCKVLEAAADVRVADKARAALATAIELDFRDPVRGAPLATPKARAVAAQALRVAILTDRKTTTTQPAAATRPKPRTPATRLSPATLLSPSVRAAWSDGKTTQTLLGDLAMTALACAERTAAFAAESDVLTRELQGVLSRRRAAGRAARLVRQVHLADPRDDADGAKALELTAQEVERLKRLLRSNSAGMRARAIALLRIQDSPVSAMVLIDRLAGSIRAGKAEFAVMNRILRVLTEMSDPRIPLKLAELIEPAKTNYAAHRIAMTLLAGSTYQGTPQQVRYQLAINHSVQRRTVISARWRTLAVSCPWGPDRLSKVIAGRAGPPPAWQPAEATAKLLTAFVHYTDLTGRLLRTCRPPAGAEPPKMPALSPGKGGIAGPAGNERLARATGLLAAELIRLARGHDRGKAFAVQIDMIDLGSKVRMLSCETQLQKAAVRLETAGRGLEVLVLESDSRGAKKPVVAETRRQRDRAAAAAIDVLGEMREHCYYNLVLLELLGPGGP